MTIFNPDVLIVGAGPAGMAAAVRFRGYGLAVLVVDEQAEPGGQIWRGVERAANTDRIKSLGAAYMDGLKAVARFRQCGAAFAQETTLWHIEAGPAAYVKAQGTTRRLTPRAVLLATGAQERPTPFAGWTLPGVMTVGAGQILLKSSGQIAKGPVWIAGCGPLAYLYAMQLLTAGAEVAGFLDTRPKGRVGRNIVQGLAAVLGQPVDIAKGLIWLAQVRVRCRYVPYVRHITAAGEERLETITFQADQRQAETVAAQHLFVHEGIVPSVHPTMALDCDHQWNEAQDSYSPVLDSWGQTSVPSVFAAGDLAGIAGAKAACLRGELAAIGIAHKLGKRTQAGAMNDARPLRKQLRKATSARAFLDTAYRPRPSVLVPEDAVLACRCEEVTVGQIRALCRAGKGDPNRIKAFSRAGMGACQGRLCNYTVSRVLADETGGDPTAIGLYRVRPPFKPLTLEELSQLQTAEVDP